MGTEILFRYTTSEALYYQRNWLRSLRTPSDFKSLSLEPWLILKALQNPKLRMDSMVNGLALSALHQNISISVSNFDFDTLMKNTRSQNFYMRISAYDSLNYLIPLLSKQHKTLLFNELVSQALKIDHSSTRYSTECGLKALLPMCDSQLISTFFDPLLQMFLTNRNVIYRLKSFVKCFIGLNLKKKSDRILLSFVEMLGPYLNQEQITLVLKHMVPFSLKHEKTEIRNQGLAIISAVFLRLTDEQRVAVLVELTNKLNDVTIFSKLLKTLRLFFSKMQPKEFIFVLDKLKTVIRPEDEYAIWIELIKRVKGIIIKPFNPEEIASLIEKITRHCKDDDFRLNYGCAFIEMMRCVFACSEEMAKVSSLLMDRVSHENPYLIYVILRYYLDYLNDQQIDSLLELIINLSSKKFTVEPITRKISFAMIDKLDEKKNYWFYQQLFNLLKNAKVEIVHDHIFNVEIVYDHPFNLIIAIIKKMGAERIKLIFNQINHEYTKTDDWFRDKPLKLLVASCYFLEREEMEFFITKTLADLSENPRNFSEKSCKHLSVLLSKLHQEELDSLERLVTPHLTSSFNSIRAAEILSKYAFLGKKITPPLEDSSSWGGSIVLKIVQEGLVICKQTLEEAYSRRGSFRLRFFDESCEKSKKEFPQSLNTVVPINR